MSHRRELGFVIWKDIGSGLTVMSRPIGSDDPTETRFGDLELEKKGLEADFDGKTFFIMGTLHFHPPYLADFIQPSPADLDSKSARRTSVNRLSEDSQLLGRLEVDVPPIDIIVLPRRSGMSMLVYQEMLWCDRYASYGNNGLSNGPMPAINEDLDLADSNKGVLEILGVYKYKALVARASTSGRLEAADARAIANTFAFTPHHISYWDKMTLNENEEELVSAEAMKARRE